MAPPALYDDPESLTVAKLKIELKKHGEHFFKPVNW